MKEIILGFKAKAIYYKLVMLKDGYLKKAQGIKGCLQKQNGIWDIVPKGGRGSQSNPKFFMIKLRQRGNEGGGHDCHIPNEAHQFSLKRD